MGILDRIKRAATATQVTAAPAPRMHLRPAKMAARAPTPLNEVFARGGPRPGVSWSDDLARILGLPRRPPFDIDGEQGQALADMMTARLQRPDSATHACRCRELGRIDNKGQTVHLRRLKPVQAWALYEAPMTEGLVGAIGVGHGKTLLDILIALVMPRCKVAVLLIPPGLVNQLKADYYAIREHFRVPSIVCGRWGEIVPGTPVVHVVPYSQLQQPAHTELIKRLKPDLIISDEAHRLRNPGTASTGRVLRYFADEAEELEQLRQVAARGCRLCCWSGTLTGAKLEEYAPLCTIALGLSSPLPVMPKVVEEWGTAINAQLEPAPAGELARLCENDETLWEGFNRRLRETRGVVTTKASAVDASLFIHERKAPPIPDEIRRLLNEVRKNKERPDGEELLDPMSVARCLRELSCGFYYRWKFPRTPATDAGDALIKEWFARRKAFMGELRDKLKSRAEHLDSERLCTNAAIRFHARGKKEHDHWCPTVITREVCDELGEEMPRDRSCACGVVRNPRLPLWESFFWPAWNEIKAAVYHETEAVWVDDYLARDAAAWAQKNLGIVWYDQDAFGERVAALSGLPKHEGGPKAEALIMAERGKKRSIIASIKAHGTGRDGLQYMFVEQLVANPPSSGDQWEQLLGRLHRIGQSADEVTTHVYRHTPEMADAIDKAVLKAKYIQGTMGTEQKLLAASVTWDL